MKRSVLAILCAFSLAGVLAGCGPGPAPQAKRGPVPPFVTIGAIMPEGAPMNIFAASSLVRPGMDIMPLAISKNSANLNAFYPALASHWQLSKNGRTVTVWLRQNARWSNGQPVTAQDVVTTMACSYATGFMQAAGLGSVKVIGPKEVQLTQAPGPTSTTFLLSVLTSLIVPKSVFGPLLPHNVWTLIKETQYTGTNAAALKTEKAAQTALTALSTKITGFAPTKDVSSGPFVIQSVNPGEMIMVRNPDFFDAAKIPVNEVIIRNFTGSQEVWNYAISGQVDELTGNMPMNIYNKALKTPGNVPYKVPAYVMASLVFNEHVYPYNLLAVRQALAYLINRTNVSHLANPIMGSNPQYLTGMTDAAAIQWLTSAQLKALKQYRTNAAKAASLLRGAGFKKVGSQWIMPNGKPWTATLTTVSQFSSWMVMAQVIRSTMVSFGIPTNAVGVTFPQMLANQKLGKYALSFSIGGQGPDPYFAYNRLYGAPDGYVRKAGALLHYPASDPTGGNWVDFPTSVKVPGYGSVNVGQLTAQLNTTTNPVVVRRDAQTLAATTNYYVPEITMWNISLNGWVNTQHFTDYPLSNQSLMLATEGFYPPVGIWMMEGYVKPRG